MTDDIKVLDSNQAVACDDRYLELGNHRVRYSVQFKKGDELPLVICGGLGQSLDTLAPLMDHMTERTVITFDAIGVGKSTVPIKPYSLNQHANAVMQLLDHLGYEAAHFMGISWGGILAQNIARRFPERCLKLVLTVSCAGGMTLVPGSVFAAAELLFPLRHVSKKYRDWAISRLYGIDDEEHPDEALLHNERNVKPSLWGYYSQMAAVRFWTSMHWLHKIDHPALIVAGKNDPLIPMINQRMLAMMMPNARLLSVDCGHLLFVIKAEEYAADVEQFLDDSLQAA